MLKTIKNHLKRMMRKTVILSNVAEGTHLGGMLTYSASAAITPKYLFGKQTSTQGQISVSGSGNTSTGARAIGVITDEADAIGDPVAVAILGSTGTTQKALAGGSIAVGDLVTADTNSKAVAFSAQAAGTYYIYGIALTAAASGDLVEFATTPGLTQTK